MKYTRRTKINSHDIYPNGTLRPTAIIKELQESANLCSEEQGPTENELRERGYAFVVSKMTVSIYSDVKKYDDVEVSTWAADLGGAFSYGRCYEMRRNGELVCEALAIFALLDTERGRPVKNGTVELNYCSDEPLILDVPARLYLPSQDCFVLAGEHTVRLSHTDANGHMNNTRYADMLCDFIPDMQSRRALRITITYQKEAKLGEELKIHRCETEYGVFFFRTLRSDGKTNIEAEIVCEDI